MEAFFSDADITWKSVETLVLPCYCRTALHLPASTAAPNIRTTVHRPYTHPTKLLKHANTVNARNALRGGTEVNNTAATLLLALLLAVGPGGNSMHIERGVGLPAIKVEDIVDIARAAGRVIMDVYKTDPEVR